MPQATEQKATSPAAVRSAAERPESRLRKSLFEYPWASYNDVQLQVQPIYSRSKKLENNPIKGYIIYV